MANDKEGIAGGGEMGQLVRSMDWSKTPLGSIESWPQSLRTTVSLCLASRFPTVIYWGAAFACVYNDGYAPILGSKHPWALGRAAREVWSEIWAVIAPMLEGVVTTGIATWSENQLLFLERRGYREECYFTFSFAPVQAESGGVGGVFTAVTETTRQVIGERRLQTLRELAIRTSKTATVDEACRLAAEALSENPSDLPFVLLYLLDRDGQHAKLAGVTGLPAGLSASPTAVDLTSADLDVAWPLAHVAKIQRPAMVDDLERRFGPLPVWEGRIAPHSALVLPVQSPGDPRVVGLLVAGVSPQLDLEQMYRSFLELVTGHVAAAVASVEALQEARGRADTLAELDREKTAFFSNVSHEFRTPLTLMLGPLEDELAERTNPLPAARHERIKTAHRNSLRLLKLVNTLLDFTSIGAGRVQTSYEATDLAAYTAELASSFRSAVEKGGLSLTVDCPPLPEPVYVDREMWEKIVLNLLSNAFKHTFEGGIGVSLAWRGDYVQLAVVDSGVGIPDVELPRLFDRFHRVRGAKSRTYEGTGIGLALVQELIRAHGGAVRVESREGEGSSFIVTVKAGRSHLPPDRIGAQRSEASTTTPAATYVEEALHWASHSPAASASPSPSGARPRVLWADDNHDMREYVRRLLSECYDVTAVSDGVTAVASALAEPPDLVLTDVMMPGLDGFGVIRALRADERTMTIPVILLSARAGEEAAIEGLDAGADDYLVKPFSARELLARVRTHLEMAGLRRERAVELGLRARERIVDLARRRTEEEARQLNADLERRVRERTSELAIAKERAEGTDRLKSEFLANMSHELRTPLNAIIGFAELMHRGKVGPVSADHEEYLGDILTSSKHLLQLINDVLDLAKVESGQMECRAESVELATLAREVCDILRGLTASGRLQMATHVDPAVATVVVDPFRVKQILYNYVSNAIKFTPAGGRVTIRILPEGPALFRIDVEDTGVGIAADDLGRLFVEFQQLDAGAAKKYQGTGLGLALTKKLAEAHGGRVAVRSLPGHGSTFTVILPRVMTRAAADGVAGPVLGLPAGNRTILVVDDDPAALKLASLALREMGYRPACCADPEDALRTVAADPPGIVIVDLLMPGVDGFEFVSRFRAMPAGRDVPIIVWTVKDLDANERRRLQPSITGLVSKHAGGSRALVEELQRLLPLAVSPPKVTDVA